MRFEAFEAVFARVWPQKPQCEAMDTVKRPTPEATYNSLRTKVLHPNITFLDRSHDLLAKNIKYIKCISSLKMFKEFADV